MSPTCPLCLQHNCINYHRDKRQYWQCQDCQLVFVGADDLPSLAAERAEYDKHQNTIGDSGYRRFLSRATVPLIARMAAPAKGLDFGCGPGPALAAMLNEQGYQVACYDPAYFPEQGLLAQRYDFITCTEVIEHIHQPRQALAMLATLLRASGLLVIMTKRVIDADAFKTWHYKNDPTHVCFYSEATFEYIAHWLGLQLEVVDNDVVILQRNSRNSP